MRLKKFFNMRKIVKKGKILLLAYDQGIEHGPTDFNDKNVDPKYIIDIARKGEYTGLILQKGIAEKYYEEIRKSRVPLVLKLNGKTNLVKGDPFSEQLCSVEEAIKLGAVAIGYTIYIGSIHEAKMFEDFEKIQEEAHRKGLPIVLWIYPRGIGIKSKSKTELMAYACRVGLEIGADIIKIHPEGTMKDFGWAVKSAGKVKVICAGGSRMTESVLLKKIVGYIEHGGSGMAIGRNIWQAKDPLRLTEKIRKVIWR